MEKLIAVHHMLADDGTGYDVHEIQEYTDANSLKGPSWIKGLSRLELPDGSPVNYKDEDTFQIVVTGQIIRRA